MALLVSATDLAIALAVKAGTLRLVPRTSRYGLGDFIAIEDQHGLIEVTDSAVAAEARVTAIREATNA